MEAQLASSESVARPIQSVCPIAGVPDRLVVNEVIAAASAVIE